MLVSALQLSLPLVSHQDWLLTYLGTLLCNTLQSLQLVAFVIFGILSYCSEPWRQAPAQVVSISRVHLDLIPLSLNQSQERRMARAKYSDQALGFHTNSDHRYITRCPDVCHTARSSTAAQQQLSLPARNPGALCFNPLHIGAAYQAFIYGVAPTVPFGGESM